MYYNNNNNKIMEFSVYDKIHNYINKHNPEFENIKKWAVTEKIHGANFSFVYSNGEYKYARRTGIIKEGENFYNYQEILPENLPKVKEIINQVSEMYPKYKTIIVYGELFGGSYPNIETKSKPVQKGVFYSPKLHFYAFDIFVIEEDKQYYVDYEFSLEIFKRVDIFHAEPLEIFDNIDDALKYPIGFNSTIPKKFGLPELEINKAEGIVIKSMTGKFSVKVKIPEFSEVDFKKINVDKSDLYEFAEAHITQNRYDNVISKIGEVKNKYEIYNMFVDDILDEMTFKDNSEKKHIKKWLYRQIRNKF